MKRFFILIILSFMIFSLAACGEDSASGSGNIDISKLNKNQVESTEVAQTVNEKSSTEAPTINKEFEDSEKIDSDIIQNQSECFLSELSQNKKYKIFEDVENEESKVFNMRNDTNSFVIISWIGPTGTGNQELLSSGGKFGIKIDNKIAFEYKTATANEIESLLQEKQENPQIKEDYQYVKVSSLELNKPIKSQNYKYIYNNMDFNVILEIDGSEQKIEKNSFYYYNLEDKEFLLKKDDGTN